jgi:miniconductance mechanosensitive channel
MVNLIKEIIINHGASEKLSIYISNIVVVLAIILLSIIANMLSKRFLLGALRTYILKSKNKWDDILLERKVFERLSHIIPAAIIHAFAPVFPNYQNLIQKIAFVYIISIIVFAFDRLLDAADDIYKGFEVSKIKPIKGYLQLTKILFYVVGAIVAISIFLERSP